MGNGSSTLTSIQGTDIVRNIRKEYEICIHEKLTESEQQIRLLKKYNELITETSTTNQKISKRLSRGLSTDQTKAPLRRKQSRLERKSLESKPDNTKRLRRGNSRGSFPVAETKETLISSVSTPEIKNTDVSDTVVKEEEKMDTWDSVKGQPSCLICKMVFDTPQKLSKHEKYSSLHASNVKRLEESARKAEEKDEPVKVATTSEEAPTARCRVLYTGSKYFWRSQDSFDLHIYLHHAPGCIEIIPYSSKTNKELPRVYMDEKALVDYVGEETISNRVKAIQDENASKRFKSTLPSTDILYEEEKRIVLSSHIVAHLQMDSAEDGSKLLRYVPSAPIFGAQVVLGSRPEGLIPVFIARRRTSSEEEIKETMDDLENMQDEIRRMTEQAERMANLVTIGAEGFSTAAAKRRQRLEKYSVPRRRWVW
eukprot:CAMPEP_0185019780 /NCGR_PEP_ID=MMETSP1103-20130426/2365_1 /TAXON_ID=36769 /ORGANISM="Paraphysomonas bandaiensis, Strain Caron Lab Isolate" /LENGTH=424 /DNA_ID=CAMNT_0027550261 /DNA_START=37 /DNA_END=1308 /DNA_ORIENTATION=+